MKNLLENVKIGLQMVVLGAILLYIGTTIFMPELTVKIFGFQPFIVVTESMEPYIDVNDSVIVTKFDIEEAKVGDIITFKADIDYNGTEEVVTHYIYSISGSGEDVSIRTHRHFEENEEVVPDTWILDVDDVIGTYSFQIQYLGYVTGFLKSTYGIAVIGINLLIFGAYKYFDNKYKTNEERQTKIREQKVTS